MMRAQRVPLEEKEIRLADMVLAKSLWPHIRPYAWMLVMSTLLVFLGIFFELSIPMLIQRAIDGFILPGDGRSGTRILGMAFESFQGFGLFFGGVILLVFAVEFCQMLFMEYTGQKIIFHLRCTLFSHMTGLPVAYYDENASGRLVARVAGDIENMNEMFTSVLVFIFKDLVLMASILGILFFIDARLSLMLSLLIPIILASTLGFSRMVRNAFRTIRQKLAEINHSFSEGISGIKVIQTTASRNRFIQRFQQLNHQHFKAALSQIRVFSIFMPFIGFLGTLSTAVIIWSGSFSVSGDLMTLGELVAFLTYMKLFFRPLRELSEKFNLLQNALASAERITTVLNRPRERQRTSSERARLDRIDTLELDDVRFSYDGKTPVLKHISFSLEKGKSIGIAGQTGSGKSSVINLITGFYRPDSGRIRFNGIAHDTINTRDIRQRTALVMQDPVLFSGTIRDNLSPVSPPLSDDLLTTALDKANCGFLFDKFKGLDTRVSEGGRPLSSGEKQLVCIARAFAVDPDLIIFDEATSYMDSRSEKWVHDAMNKLMQGRMSIIIAHRLSTIRECDRILLLRDGEIREQGSHAELVRAGGEYFHLLEKEKI